MWRVGIGSAAALILLTNGLLEGVSSNRWHRPAELEKGIGRVKRIPMTIGDWHGQSEELDDAVMTRAGIEGYSYAHYENQFSGKKTSVLLTVARPGPPRRAHTGLFATEAQATARKDLLPSGNKGIRRNTSAEFLAGPSSPKRMRRTLRACALRGVGALLGSGQRQPRQEQHLPGCQFCTSYTSFIKRPHPASGWMRKLVKVFLNNSCPRWITRCTLTNNC